MTSCKGYTGPRSASQARFDRWKDTGTGAKSPLNRDLWSETDFNWHMRQALMDQGYRTLHIREAHETGVADLMVYSKRTALDVHKLGGHIVATDGIQVLDAWLELKIDNDLKGKNIRPAQKEFMRDHWVIGKNAMFLMRDKLIDMLVIRQGDLKGRTKWLAGDPYAIRWGEVFAEFKGRR